MHAPSKWLLLLVGFIGFQPFDVVGEKPIQAGISVPQRDRHVEARLLSEYARIRPGQSWWVALELKHDPTWHTYWQNGGDAGVPTAMDWQLPDGITAGPIQWEPPQIVKMLQLDVYGYEGTCLLLTKMQCDPNASLPDEFEIHAKVTWMMCSKTCLPGKGVDLSMNLRRATGANQAPLAPWANRIRQSAARIPESAPNDMFTASYDASKKVFQLNWEAFPLQEEVLEVYYFGTTDQITSNQAQAWTQVAGGWQLTLPRASYAPDPFDRLRGVLRWKHAGSNEPYRWLALDVPVASP